MIKTAISDFPAPFTAINGKRTLRATHLDLVRCTMTTGLRKCRDAHIMGLFALAERACMCLDTVRRGSNDFFRLSDSFPGMDASEKRVATYRLGMGIAKLAIEKMLKAPWPVRLAHVDGVVSKRKGFAPPKVRICHSDKPPSQPELISFDGHGRAHILEAKGYSSGASKITMQHAIDRVSQVISVNEKPPATRTVCFSDLSNDICLTMRDPQDDEHGVKLKVDVWDCLTAYYKPLLDSLRFDHTHPDTLETKDTLFYLRQIWGAPMFFGVDRRVFDLVDTPVKTEEALNEFVNTSNTVASSLRKSASQNGHIGSEQTSFTAGHEFAYSFGLDGIILLCDSEVLTAVGGDKPRSPIYSVPR